MNRTVLCLLLLSATSLATAREVRMHGPTGDGGTCPEAAAAATSAPPAAKHAPVAVRAGKARTPTTFRGGGDDTNTSRPRWHSFLPGMFR